MRVSVKTSATSSAPLTVLCLERASSSASRPGWIEGMVGGGIGVDKPWSTLDGSLGSSL